MLDSYQTFLLSDKFLLLAALPDLSTGSNVLSNYEFARPLFKKLSFDFFFLN